MTHSTYKARLSSVAPKEGVYLVEDTTDIYYLTGLDLSLGFLLISPKENKLFVDGRYAEYADKHSPIDVGRLEDKEIQAHLNKLNVSTVHIDAAKITLAQFQSLEKRFEKITFSLQSESAVSNARLVKDSAEQVMLKQSAKLIYEAVEMIPGWLEEGMTEIVLANKVEAWIKARGAKQFGFDPIIAFGKNSALPHHHTGLTKLQKGDIILVDMGCTLNHYQSDMTRVFFFGDVKRELKEIYELTRAAHASALKLCRAGVTVGELDHAARRAMGEYEKYYIHSLGHGIGLEVHENPRITSKGKSADFKLEAGMAITIEPGIYIPDLGGVRYEDTIIITESHYENLYPGPLDPQLLD